MVRSQTLAGEFEIGNALFVRYLRSFNQILIARRQSSPQLTASFAPEFDNSPIARKKNFTHLWRPCAVIARVARQGARLMATHEPLMPNYNTQLACADDNKIDLVVPLLEI
jgi:hypothetical protein